VNELFNPSPERRIVGEMSKEHAGGSPVVLTRREIDVAEKLSLGLSDKEIASELGITKDTISSYKRGLFIKLRANNRTLVVINYTKWRTTNCGE
jgi:DNA-binding NarL/FixJ family response regulator